jgi:hypothetical protein
VPPVMGELHVLKFVFIILWLNLRNSPRPVLQVVVPDLWGCILAQVAYSN